MTYECLPVIVSVLMRTPKNVMMIPKAWNIGMPCRQITMPVRSHSP